MIVDNQLVDLDRGNQLLQYHHVAVPQGYLWVAASPAPRPIVALNTIATQATIGVLFFAAFADRSIYLDVAIWLASFSYLGTIVWARYLERGLL